MENLLSDTFSHHQVGRKLARFQPAFSMKKIYLSLRLQTYSLSYYLPESKAQQLNRGKRKRDGYKFDTTLIYVSLSRWDIISLWYPWVFIICLTNDKIHQSRNSRERMSWLLKAAQCVVVHQHCWMSSLSNFVTQTHNHTHSQKERDSGS